MFSVMPNGSLGCSGAAQFILTAPDEVSWECSSVDASSDYTPVTTVWSVCLPFPTILTTDESCSPIEEDQMYSGTWILVILVNNGDDSSESWQRSLNLTVGIQATVTSTPTGRNEILVLLR